MGETESMTLYLPADEMRALRQLGHDQKLSRSRLMREAVRLLFTQYGVTAAPLPVAKPIQKRYPKPPTIQRHASYYLNMSLSELMRHDEMESKREKKPSKWADSAPKILPKPPTSRK